MHKSSPLRRATASLTALALVFSAVGPAMAQAPAAKATAPAAAPKAAAPAAAPKAAAPQEKAEPAPQPAADAAEATPTTEEAGVEAAPAGPSPEDLEAARTSFEAGMKAFDEGQFSTAADEFKKAHSTLPSPHAEYWIAVSLDKADAETETPGPTAAAYALFLGNPGAANVGEDKVAEAKARHEQLQKLLPAELTIITSPPGAQVTINGEAQEGVTPLTVPRPAGTYTVVATLEGHEALTAEVALEGGVILEQQMNLAKTPEPAAVAVAPVEEKAEPSKVPAYVTLGIAGAGLITGTVFGILALDSKSKYDANPSSALADDTERNALIADMALGVAITLGITGIVLLTAGEDEETTAKASPKRRVETATRTAPKRHPREGQLVITPYGGPTGGGGVARLTF